MKKRNKRGSHVGVVVSFVIFVTFLLFLFVVLEPLTVKQRGKGYILDYLKLDLLSNVVSEVTVMTIVVDEPVGPQPCLNLQNIIGDGDDKKIPEYMVGNLFFKSSGESFTYERNEDHIRLNTGNDFQGTVYVYYSENIEYLEYDGPSGCSPKSYSVGTIDTEEELLESNLLALNETYYADYEGLKLELGIPEGTEFSFKLLDAKREPIFEAKWEDPPSDTSVYVEETPIEYVGTDGETKFGFLVITLW